MTLSSLKAYVTARPKIQWVLFVLVVAIIALTFQWEGLNDAFLSDDFDWVTNAQESVESGNWFAPFTTETGGHFFRPLVAFGFQIDYWVGGFSPLPYHLHQLLFHILVIVGVAYTVFQLTKNRLLAFLAGGLFLFFPNHQEVVTWLAGRPDLYAATFSVWAIGFYAQHIQKKSWTVYGVSILLTFCAFLSKEIAFVVPFLLALTLLYLKPIRPLKTFLLSFVTLIPWAVLIACIVLIRNSILSDAIGGYTVAGNRLAIDISASNPSHIFLSFFNLVNWSYVAELLNNSIVYRGLFKLWTWIVMYWYIALAATATGIFFLARHKDKIQKKLIWYSIGWILVSFVPVFGLTDEISTSRLVASRLFFFASIGYAIFLSVILFPKPKATHHKSRIQVIVLVALLFVLSLLWKINSTPWHTAADEVNKVSRAVSAYTLTHTFESNDIIVADNLPDIIHGAYTFFGKHAFPGVLTQEGISRSVQSFQTNGSQYENSPFCSCATSRTHILQWNGTNKTFNALDNLSDRLLVSTARCVKEKVLWDFSNEEDRAQWRIHEFGNAIATDGLTLTIPSKSNGYLESIELANLFSADAKTITLSFTVDSINSDRENKTLLAWKTEQGYDVSQQIGYTYTKGTQKTITIPLCEFVNWAVSGDIKQLRLRPITGATITLHSIQLN